MEHLSEVQVFQIVERSKEVKQKWLDHLQICNQCQKSLSEELELTHGLRKLEYQRPSMRFARNIYEILGEKEKLANSETFWIKIIQISILGSFSLAIVLITVLFFKIGLPDVRNETIATMVNWNLSLFCSVLIFWILYIADSWYGGQKRRNKMRSINK